MNFPLVSIIVPVYNTPEDKLRKCIASIVGQDYKNIELLLIDDGSHETTAVLLDKIADDDERVRVIHKENEGPGMSRNFGMDNALGEYACFVDSDDFILPYVISSGVKLLLEYDADMVIGMTHKDYFPQQLTERTTDKDIYVISDRNDKIEYVNHMLGYTSKRFAFSNGYIGDGPISRIFKLKMSENARFPQESYWSEDTIWNLEIAKVCNKIVLIDELWYEYIINSVSLTQGYRENCLSEYKTRVNQEWTIFKKEWSECINGFSTKIWREFYFIIETLIFHPDSKQDYRQKYKVFLSALNTFEYKEAVKNLNFKNESLSIKRIVKEITRFFSIHKPHIIAYVIWKMYMHNKIKKQISAMKNGG